MSMTWTTFQSPREFGPETNAPNWQDKAKNLPPVSKCKVFPGLDNPTVVPLPKKFSTATTIQSSCFWSMVGNILFEYPRLATTSRHAAWGKQWGQRFCKIYSLYTRSTNLSFLHSVIVCLGSKRWKMSVWPTNAVVQECGIWLFEVPTVFQRPRKNRVCQRTIQFPISNCFLLTLVK